jgi:hypothetical protein
MLSFITRFRRQVTIPHILIHTKTYFALDPNTLLIKVGKSEFPQYRIKQFRSAGLPRCMLIHIIDQDVEKDIHNELHECRVNHPTHKGTEWFTITDNVLSFLPKLTRIAIEYIVFCEQLNTKTLHTTMT